MKWIFYFATCATLGFVACERNDIAPEVGVQVYLDENNTYLLGDPVRFVFKGAVDYVTAWTGDATHEYRHCDRTEREIDDIASATLDLSVMAQYSNQYGSLKMGVSDNFPGLTGPEDAANGKQGMRDKGVIADFGQAWTSVGYEQYDNKENDTKTVKFSTDVTDWKSNFSLALHWRSPLFTTTQRTYSVTPVVTVKYKDGYPDVTLRATDLGFTALSMAEERRSDAYDIGKTTSDKGVVCYTSFTTPLYLAGSVAWNEVTAAGLPYAIHTWCVSTPMGLNRVEPDRGVNIKTLNTDLPTYEYTYKHSGTYTVTFVLASGNYQGQVGPKVVEFTVTVIDPLGR